MVDPISISDAAKNLDLSPARVRVMASRGQLAGAKLGDRWFVERAAVERRRREGSLHGRRFSPRNAWALLALASGEDVEGIDSSVRSRLRRALASQGLRRLAPRLALRAEARSFRAHPGEVSHILRDPELVLSGISAAGEYGFGLVSGREADGYLQEAKLKSFVSRHALTPADLDGNVRLRVVPEEAGRFFVGRRIAPPPAVALDLAEEADPRSAQSGQRALRDLDRGLARARRA
ncbi:MAG TPA: hypothetical protein VK889_02900 [Solirubrobacterales bacterium]|nr:hypothetical protein [Solirubrobacterales bacterium]